MADKRRLRRRRRRARRAHDAQHLQRVDAQHLQRVDVDAAAGRGQLTATLRAVYATKPPPPGRFALVTWSPGPECQMDTPRYFATRDAALAAAPTDRPSSVVDIQAAPGPNQRGRYQNAEITDTAIRAARKRQAEGSSEWIAATRYEMHGEKRKFRGPSRSIPDEGEP